MFSRLRKGYSELSNSEKKKRLKKLKEEDKEYLDDIENFCGESAADCVDYISTLLSESTLPAEVIKRSISILDLLRKRAEAILDSDEAADKDGLQSAIALANSLLQLHRLQK